MGDVVGASKSLTTVEYSFCPRCGGPLASKSLTTVEYSFCPRCGGPLASRKLKPSEPERLVCTRCGFIFFLDPKVAAGTLFTIEGKIPLLQRAIEPSYGKWVFPGGFVDRGEAVQDAAVRETREEARLEVRLVSLLNVYSYSGSPVILVVYAAEVIGGELEAGDECLDVRLFAPRRDSLAGTRLPQYPGSRRRVR